MPARHTREWHRRVRLELQEKVNEELGELPEDASEDVIVERRHTLAKVLAEKISQQRDELVRANQVPADDDYVTAALKPSQLDGVDSTSDSESSTGSSEGEKPAKRSPVILPLRKTEPDAVKRRLQDISCEVETILALYEKGATVKTVSPRITRYLRGFAERVAHSNFVAIQQLLAQPEEDEAHDPDAAPDEEVVITSPLKTFRRASSATGTAPSGDEADDEIAVPNDDVELRRQRRFAALQRTKLHPLQARQTFAEGFLRTLQGDSRAYLLEVQDRILRQDEAMRVAAAFRASRSKSIAQQKLPQQELRRSNSSTKLPALQIAREFAAKRKQLVESPHSSTSESARSTIVTPLPNLKREPLLRSRKGKRSGRNSNRGSARKSSESRATPRSRLATPSRSVPNTARSTGVATSRRSRVSNSKTSEVSAESDTTDARKPLHTPPLPPILERFRSRLEEAAKPQPPMQEVSIQEEVPGSPPVLAQAQKKGKRKAQTNGKVPQPKKAKATKPAVQKGTRGKDIAEKRRARANPTATQQPATMELSSLSTQEVASGFTASSSQKPATPQGAAPEGCDATTPSLAVRQQSGPASPGSLLEEEPFELFVPSLYASASCEDNNSELASTSLLARRREQQRHGRDTDSGDEPKISTHGNTGELRTVEASEEEVLARATQQLMNTDTMSALFDALGLATGPTQSQLVEAGEQDKTALIIEQLTRIATAAPSVLAIRAISSQHSAETAQEDLPPEAPDVTFLTSTELDLEHHTSLEQTPAAAISNLVRSLTQYRISSQKSFQEEKEDTCKDETNPTLGASAVAAHDLKRAATMLLSVLTASTHHIGHDAEPAEKSESRNSDAPTQSALEIFSEVLAQVANVTCAEADGEELREQIVAGLLSALTFVAPKEPGTNEESNSSSLPLAEKPKRVRVVSHSAAAGIEVISEQLQQPHVAQKLFEVLEERLALAPASLRVFWESLADEEAELTGMQAATDEPEMVESEGTDETDCSTPVLQQRKKTARKQSIVLRALKLLRIVGKQLAAPERDPAEFVVGDVPAPAASVVVPPPNSCAHVASKPSLRIDPKRNTGRSLAAEVPHVTTAAPKKSYRDINHTIAQISPLRPQHSFSALSTPLVAIGAHGVALNDPVACIQGKPLTEKRPARVPSPPIERNSPLGPPTVPSQPRSPFTKMALYHLTNEAAEQLPAHLRQSAAHTASSLRISAFS
eukprot:TRINITY_DN9347_c0_g1_i1.p1 TRINITY_DN9347_c0_g1~~TRINITY_DN9347_c0_g1_i1.p1  ORF type:complete len:1216 (+),score=186.15 TRINITY_DN9347_c0_g1_i1:674-4321(+)